MKVGESIRKLREANNLTQEQLGEIAGVSGMAVSQWENGRSVPRMGAIQRMSDRLGVKKSVIMGDAVEYYGVSLDEPKQSDELDELCGLYRSMTDEGRSQLMIYARGLAATYPKNQVDTAEEIA